MGVTAVPSSREPAPAGQGCVSMQFDDNRLSPQLFGERAQHLDRIERQLGVSVVSRGNRLAIAGPEAATDIARAALLALYDRLKRGLEVDAGAVDAALRLANNRPTDNPVPLWDDATAIHTRKRRITARSPMQAAYIRALREREMVFGLGPAGTGKTYLAVAAAVDNLMSGGSGGLLLSRPAGAARRARDSARCRGDRRHRLHRGRCRAPSARRAHRRRL